MSGLALVALTGCVTLNQHRVVEARVVALETELQALQDRLAPMLPPSPEDERASRELLESAMAASEELRWDDARAEVDALLAGYPNTQAARVGAALAEEFEVVGRDALELEVERWFQGSADDLSDDKATIYVFWEAWCPHCQREVPKLSATYEQYREQGLGLVGLTELTRDVTEEDVAAFIEDNDVNYPIAKEKDQALAVQYGIRGIPAAAMVKEGKVVWRGHPASLSDELIEKMLLP